jgi:hypothetical protein
MVSLTQDSKGNYRARKRLPDDVREDYRRLFGRGNEEKFFRKADARFVAAAETSTQAKYTNAKRASENSNNFNAMAPIAQILPFRTLCPWCMSLSA